MPRLSQWFIRAALIHLALGFTFGALMLGNKGVPFYPLLWRLLPAHIEFLLLGWTLQLALGVAFWIMPRFWQAPARGNETGAWVAFVLLNLGVWAVSIAGVFALPPAVTFVGRVLEVGAAVAFAIHIWPRVVPRTGNQRQ